MPQDVNTGKLYIWKENKFYYIGFESVFHNVLLQPKKYVIRRNDTSHALIPTNAILRGFSAYWSNGLVCLQIAENVMNQYGLIVGKYTAGLWHDMIIF